MDVEAVVTILGQCATLPAERELLRHLNRVQDHPDLAPEEGARQREADLALAAPRILDFPWGRLLPRDCTAALEQLAGSSRTALDHLAGFLRSGCGRRAVERCAGGLIRVPTWMVTLAEQRAGEAIDAIAERWAIAPGWPVPTKQALIAHVPDLEALDYDSFWTGVLGPHLEVENAEYPQDWRSHSSGSLTRAARLALLRADPCAGMRALLSVPGEPLVGVAHEIAMQILFQVRWLSLHQRGWQGEWGASMLWLYGDHVLLEGGWLCVLLELCGLAGLGMTKATTMPAESMLVSTAGGSVHELKGGREVHRLPWAAGQVLTNLAVDWSLVNRLG